MNHEIVALARALKLNAFAEYKEYVQESSSVEEALYLSLIHIYPGEVLWFVENSGDGLVRCRATVKKVFSSEKLTEQESQKLISDHQAMLSLPLIKLSDGVANAILCLSLIHISAPAGYDRRF